MGSATVYSHDVEYYKVQSEPSGLDIDEFAVWKEIVHHPSHNHINVCVGDEWPDQNEDEPRRIPRVRCRVLYRDDSEGEDEHLK